MRIMCNIPDATIVYKLEHLVVKKIVESLFKYNKGIDIMIDALN